MINVNSQTIYKWGTTKHNHWINWVICYLKKNMYIQNCTLWGIIMMGKKHTQSQPIKEWWRQGKGVSVWVRLFVCVVKQLVVGIFVT